MMGRWETMENALKAVDDVAEAWRRDRRELRDEVNWLHAELHGAEMDADYMRKGSKARQAYLMGVEDGREQGNHEGYLEGVMHLTEARNIEFGSPEHIAGLSRAALETDFRFVNDRRNELEDACEQLEAENTRLRSCLEDAAENERLTTHEFNQLKEERDKLRELVLKLHDELLSCEENEYICGGHKFDEDVRELGVEV